MSTHIFLPFYSWSEKQKVDLKLSKSILVQSVSLVGFPVSDTISFVYYSALSWLPYCNLQLNSIKLPLPGKNVLLLCSRVLDNFSFRLTPPPGQNHFFLPQAYFMAPAPRASSLNCTDIHLIFCALRLNVNFRSFFRDGKSGEIGSTQDMVLFGRRNDCRFAVSINVRS